MRKTSWSFAFVTLVIVLTIIVILGGIFPRACMPPINIVTPTATVSFISPSPSPAGTAVPTATYLVATDTAVPKPSPTPAPTNTATASPTATQPPAPTATPEPTNTPAPNGVLVLIVPGSTYWHTAGDWFGAYVCWQTLRRVNGWHERALPIGEFMTVPGDCEELR